MMNLLIRYNKPSYIAFPFVVHKATKEELARGMTDTMDRVQLIGGYNEVDEKIWNKVKDHPLIVGALEEEIIEIVTKTDQHPLAEMTQVKALKVVGDTNDIEVLKQWARDEDRPAVRNVIGRRLEVLVLPDRRAAKGINEHYDESTQPRATNKVRTKVKAAAPTPEFSDEEGTDETPSELRGVPTSVTKSAAMKKVDKAPKAVPARKKR
jgi:hypothetical protein